MARRSEGETRIPERRRAAREATADTLGAAATVAGERETPRAFAGEPVAEPVAGQAEKPGPGMDGHGGLSPDLAALLEEATPAAAPAAAAPEIPRATLITIASSGVTALGTVGCRLAKVTPLESGEVTTIAEALYELCSAYDLLGQLDPRTAAWLNLGLVASAVLLNRKRLEEEPAQPELKAAA